MSRAEFAAWVKSLPKTDRGLAVVIKELRREYLCTDKNGKNAEPCPCKAFEGCLAKPFIQTIQLLEAVGRVEKMRALSLLNGSLLHHQLSRAPADGPMWAIDEEGTAQIRVLLESLPE